MSKKERQKEKLKDIHQDNEGNLIYTGELLKASGDVSGVRVKLITGIVVIAAAVVASGCIDAAGANNSFYVILPYIGEVAAAFVLVWNSVRVVYAAGGIRKYILDTCSSRIPGACRMLTVFAVAGMIGSCIYMAQWGMGGQTLKSILYPLLKVIAAVAAEMFRRYYDNIIWE